MSNTLEVKALEQGAIRVFALSMEPTRARALSTSDAAALGPLLGLDALDPAHVEIFPVSDLDELGLAGYLRDGHGIDAEALAPAAARLAALDGWVMIVYSRAFHGEALTLEPAPQVTLIAEFGTPPVDWRATQRLESAAATAPGPARKRPSDAAMSGRIAMAALLVLFALTGLMVWVAG